MYDHQNIEKKWQERWRTEGVFKTDEASDKPKRFILDMFPYPSGAGLHAGHVESYTATDIYARYSRAKGFNVLHPQGFDAFGLPAENYAIKTGIHPSETTKTASANFIRQIDSLGFSYDWDRVVVTSDPEYYKWTQWMFLLMYNNGLAYKKKAKVNWCDSCQTVLAREQAEGGVCERCGNQVIQKDLEQWFFKITEFVEDQKYEGREVSGLLSGLDNLDWPESTKSAQRNWIGRSEGALVDFVLTANGLTEEKKIRVFTTRVDTIFGCTYVVLAPESALTKELLAYTKNKTEVEKYISDVSAKTELQRTDLNKDKSGVKLEGITAINPFNNEEVTVFVADYVLANYGTGAVMAVPAHDERDFEFAKKYNLEIRTSIAPENNSDEEPYCDDGLLVNSGEFTGLKSAEARTRMIDFLTRTEQGEKTINYRLRDWLVSRQRYWGAPIPIIYCDHCGEVPVPVEDLPVKLPTDVDFRPTGESPLKYSTEFHNVTCPKCGAKARRESDTMDTFVCSSWYYLRYADSKNTEVFAAADKLAKWLPVDLYFGGAEHTVLHLLYARFFTKVLKKYGYVNFNEPFLKLRHQGIILGEDGNKMSKSKGNVINPDDLVKSHGADALRLYEMFMGPLEDMKPWNSKGIIGVSRFLDRVSEVNQDLPRVDEKKIVSLLHKTIKKIGDDIEEFKYNTAISALMILVNEIYDFKNKNNSWPLSKDNLALFVRILEPFAPHLAEELWSQMGHNELLIKEPWPNYDEALLQDDTFVLAVQINGKLRSTIEVTSDITEEAVKELAFADLNVKKWVEDKEVVKVVYVKGKLLSIVIK
jgi:leucyl-tRNA synthetase, eubacterial and mitochondrial family